MKKESIRCLFILFFCLQLASLNSFAQYNKLFDLGSAGSSPGGALISDGTFLYGMTSEGGLNDLGTIYKIKPDGTGYVKLLDFDGVNNGSYPYGSLIFDGTSLYGMTSNGGANDLGTIFKIQPDGNGYIKLLDFDGTTNGSYPNGDLFSDGSFLYGMTSSGGANNIGTLFRLKPDGTSFSTLLEFDGLTNGSYPYGSLISDGTFIYGVTSSGGTDNFGTLFKIMPDGSGFNKLLEFGGSTNGSSPSGSLLFDGTSLYGMTSYGGTNDFGVIYKVLPDGTGFTKLLDFDGPSSGSYPYGSLISDSIFLYGMTSNGGTNDLGTIFKIQPDGSGFVTLLEFDGSAKGSYPNGSLLLDGGSLYGMTDSGGTSDLGTAFIIQPDGTGYTKLLELLKTGTLPSGSLVSDGTYLYGMTEFGGGNNEGTIFQVSPDGSGYITLYEFDGSIDGRNPKGSLLFDGTYLYGMTPDGGSNNAGTIFKVLPDGSDFSVLLGFDGSNGDNGFGSLISDGTYLYGMTSEGGNDNGVIFKIKPDGSDYIRISDFSGPSTGYYPTGDLLYDGTYLYGMANQGGPNGLGTIFKISTDGSNYSNVLDFDGTNTGSYPYGSLISDGTFLYGMTNRGGINDMGTIFKVMPDGSGYEKLLDFDGSLKGSYPQGSLFFVGNFLYGLTSSGGVNNAGTIFHIKSDGSIYSNLLDFDGNNGSTPYGSLTLHGTSLYGMTKAGGAATEGTIFEYAIIPSATITISTQPTNLTNCVGQPATFTIVASGTTNISYKWQVHDSEGDYWNDLIEESTISGTRTSTLSINTAGYFGEGLYRCVVSGDLATDVISNEVSLDISPKIPVAADVVHCGPASITLTATGGVNGQYRWYTQLTDALPIIGQVNNTFATPFLTTSKTYYVAINNGTCESDRKSVQAAISTCQPQPGFVWAQGMGSGATNGAGAILQDSNGNLYISGGFSGTVDFDTGPGVASLTSVGGDLYLLKMSPDGTLQWVKGIGGTGSESGGAFSFDGSGNIYMTISFSGTSDFDPGPATANLTSSGTKKDVAIVKYDSDGNFIWVKQVSGASDESAGAIKCDAVGNIYMAGQFRGTTSFGGTFSLTAAGANSTDGFFTKLDANGNFLWAGKVGSDRATGANLFSDGAFDLTIDGTNVYVIGSVFGPGNVDFDPGASVVNEVLTVGTAFILKLNTSGQYQDHLMFEGAAGGNIKTDASGNIYFTGAFGGTVDLDPQSGVYNVTGSGSSAAFIAKIDQNENFIWGKVFKTNINSIAISDIFIDGSGNVYSTGYFGGITDFDPGPLTVNRSINGLFLNTFTLKLDTNGDFNWVTDMRRIDGGFTAVSPGGITVNSSGDVYITGGFARHVDFDPGECVFALNNVNGTDIFISKFSPAVTNICFNAQPANVSACDNSTATFTSSILGTATVVYQWQKLNTSTSSYEDITNTGGYSGVTTPVLTVNTNGNFGAGEYRCKISGSITADGFSNSATLTVGPIASPSAIGASSCSVGSLILSASGGSTGQYRWYDVATGGTAFGGEVNSTYSTPILSATTNYYVAINNGTCESARTLVIAEITSTLSAPVTTGASSCGSASLMLNASGGTNGQYRWYTVATGGIAIAGEVNSSYATPSVSTTTNYYVSINDGTCESTRIIVAAQINTIPPAATTTGASNCGAAALTLNAFGGTNSQYRWYAVATAGTALTGEVNNSFTTPSVSSTSTYYVSINDGTCESSRTSVTAQINNIPSAPFTTGASGCVASSVTLNASGGTNGQYRWYTASTGGTPIAGEVNSSYTTPSLSSSTTYFVSINNGTCESTRTTVAAQINTIPIAPITTSASNCGAAALTLNASGGTNGQYRWYTVATGGTAIAGEVNSSYATPSVSTTTSYYVSINDGTCESSREPAVATINNLPAAPSTTGVSGCAPSSVTVSASGGTNGQYQWYFVATGGTPITGEVNSTYATPVLSSSTTYYVTINDGTCESQRTAVTADITSCSSNLPPTITPPTITTQVEGKVSINFTTLISDPDNNLDMTTLRVVIQPESNAVAFFDANNNLIIDYTGISFTGKDHLTIEVCDLAGSCTQQVITVDVVGDVIVYNAISLNGDDKNPALIIKYIDILAETQNNKASIYNRWGDLVWEGVNYNNTTVVFTGYNKNGNELPSGTYFYKIEFNSGRETKTGYVSLKR